MDELRISIGAEGLPSSIRFNGGHALDLDWEGPVSISDRKIRPLLLLALLTEWKRSEGNGQKGDLRRRIDSHCPSLKPRNEKAAKSLSQILCDKRTYESSAQNMRISGIKKDARKESPEALTADSPDPKQRHRVEFVENPKKKKEHWLKEFFGEWPLDKYLTANKTSWNVAFKPNVKIILEEEWGEVLEDDPRKIMQLYLNYSRSEDKTGIIVRIKLNIEDNGECPSTVIDTNFCEGSFRTNAKFWIKLITNFETNHHVFWISPDTSRIICPPVEFPDLREKHRLDDHFELWIGERQNIIVKPPAGTQTCVLLLNGEPIPPETCRQILGKIENCIPAEHRTGRPDKPVLTKHRLRENTRGLDVEPEAPQIVWQDILARRLRGYGELLYVFSVPHL